MIDFNVAVVIPAAGKSERCPGELAKQYFRVLNKPLLLYCVESFLAIPYVKKICIVSDQEEHVEQQLETIGAGSGTTKHERILIVRGGPSRHASIKNGLVALEKIDTYLKVVVVHDGARPIVPGSLVDELVEAAAVDGAAGTTRPLVSTVIKPHEDGKIDSCFDRSSYVMSETPQAFLFEMLYEAYQKCTPEELETGTECLQLALKYCGSRAKLIPGPDEIWKVTYKKDCYAASALLLELSTKVCILVDEKTPLSESLRDNLSDKVSAVYLLTRDDKSCVTANAIVCFHDREIDQDGQLLKLADVLDIDNPGIIVHVVTESEEQISGSAYDLHRSGRSMMTEYEKLKKGVVVIQFSSPGEEDRLVRLITTLILTEPSAFSGQTLFM